MKSDIERRFFLAEGISHQPSDHIDKEVEWAAMARMLDLRDVFQLIVDSLADATLAATPHRVRNEGSGDRNTSLLVRVPSSAWRVNCINTHRDLMPHSGNHACLKGAEDDGESHSELTRA